MPTTPAIIRSMGALLRNYDGSIAQDENCCCETPVFGPASPCLPCIGSYSQDRMQAEISGITCHNQHVHISSPHILPNPFDKDMGCDDDFSVPRPIIPDFNPDDSFWPFWNLHYKKYKGCCDALNKTVILNRAGGCLNWNAGIPGPSYEENYFDPLFSFDEARTVLQPCWPDGLNNSIAGLSFYISGLSPVFDGHIHAWAALGFGTGIITWHKDLGPDPLATFGISENTIHCQDPFVLEYYGAYNPDFYCVSDGSPLIISPL